MFVPSDSESANQRPMYCKDKVYTGGKEFSLEELRALNWTNKKQERERLEVQYSQMRADIMYVHRCHSSHSTCCSLFVFVIAAAIVIV